MKHYPHHIGDFDKATRHLTRIERSVYRDLIDLYYDTEQQLSLDIPSLCRKIIARSNEESTAVEQTLNEFFTETATGWFHERCEQVLADYRAHNSQKSGAGKASAAAKALRKQQALSASATDVQQPLKSVSTAGNGDSTNHKPETINHKPSISGAAPPVDKSGFDEFWGAWPKSERKQDKAACKAKWEAKGFGSLKAVVLADIATKLKTEKWQSGFIEAPLVYLNNRRWEDGVTPDVPGQSGIVRPWYDSARGVDAKAAELGLPPCGNVESRPAFKDRVIAAMNGPEPAALSFDQLSRMAARRVA